MDVIPPPTPAVKLIMAHTTAMAGAQQQRRLIRHIWEQVVPLPLIPVAKLTMAHTTARELAQQQRRLIRHIMAHGALLIQFVALSGEQPIVMVTVQQQYPQAIRTGALVAVDQ